MNASALAKRPTTIGQGEASRRRPGCSVVVEVVRAAARTAAARAVVGAAAAGVVGAAATRVVRAAPAAPAAAGVISRFDLAAVVVGGRGRRRRRRSGGRRGLPPARAQPARRLWRARASRLRSARCSARASRRRSAADGASVSPALSGCAERPTLSPEIELASSPMPTAATRPASTSAAPRARRLRLMIPP